jgi:uncharacterized protein (DUF1499 family)
MLGLGACSAQETPIDFASLERSPSGNDALACLPDACRAKADRPSPNFPQSPEALLARVRKVFLSQPRTSLVSEDGARHQLVFVQRSLVFRFPDTIWVQAEPVAAGGSVLMVYSRSNYGKSDFGVNRARLDRWLAALSAQP